MVSSRSSKRSRNRKTIRQPAARMKKRMALVAVFFTLLICLLSIRVGWIQFVRGEEYQEMAIRQQTSGRIIPAKRGTIYDRNGNILAISADVDQVAVNPKTIHDYIEDENERLEYQKYIANSLAEILDLDPEEVLKKVQSPRSYEEIKRKVERDIGDKVREWRSKPWNNKKIVGVYVDQDSKRYYPNNNLAAHILGFTGRDNQGLVTGVEYTFDHVLTGKPGRILASVDARQKELPFGEERRIEPENGNNLILTIDETIQYLVEKALDKAIEDCKVTGGAGAIVMDPHTGEILAMASKPDFDLNNPFAAPPGVDPSNWKGNTKEDIEILSRTVWRNKMLTDTYEPGSTFKAITAAALLEEGIATRDTIVEDTPLKFSGSDPINCWRAGGHGTETFEEAVMNSCNPVFSKLALQLGIPVFYKYVRAFGFYDKTGISLVGEAGSIFHKEPKEIDMAVTAFGQRFQITPLQLICAYNAIANGGTLLKPQIVKEITDSEGNVIQRFEPEVIRRVISKETSNELKSILEKVVTQGTGKNAYVKGYRVAGKTGTSQTLETDTKGRYIVSFCAMAPADNPVITLLFILDHPNVTPANLNSGGFLAAPAAGKLIEEILSYLQVERRYTEKDEAEIKPTSYVPYVEEKTIKDAKSLLNNERLKYTIVGDNSDDMVVVRQVPSPGVPIPKGSAVILYTSAEEPKRTSVVPDLKGKTIDQAFRELYNLNLSIKIYGKGHAISQDIPPGTEVEWGTVIEVDFREFDVE